MLLRKAREIEHYREELNLVSNGLICIQRQIPPNTNSWTRYYERDGVPREITCRSPEDFGVPHGLDNDVNLGLQEEFISQGCPDDNTVRVTMYRLLKMCNLEDTGRNRASVRASLDRMRSTTSWIKDSWRNHGARRWMTVTFNLLEGLAYEGDDDDPDGARYLVVTLPTPIANSIRDGYVKPVDLGIARKLDGPSRHAYRALDSKRFNPENPDLRADVVQVNLMDLRHLFGIVSERPDEIRRTLGRLEKDLVEVGYLASVTLEGRGKRQSVTFVFGERAREPNPGLVRLLLGFKVTRPVAERLVLDHEEHVEEALTLARALLEGGYKPRSVPAFVIDVVRTFQEGKYAWPEGHTPPRVVEAARAASEQRLRVAEAQVELLPQRDDDLVGTVAMLLRLPKDELRALPRPALEGLKSAALGKPFAERKPTIEQARALLASGRSADGPHAR